MDWYERAEQQLEDDLNNGLIDIREFNRGMRELEAEFRESAQLAADETYDKYMGY